MNYLNTIQNIQDLITPWLLTHGLRVLVIIIIAYIAHRFGGVIIEKSVRKAIVADPNEKDKKAEEKREDTLIKVATGTFSITIWLAAVLMIISEFGIEIGPIIAAAGVAGIAIGFGGQYLIRDIISGLFIILENQYRLGDIIQVSGVSGAVEHINLRRTTLRGLDGEVHYIPNGEIKVATNMTRDFSRINLNIGVSYDASITKVKKIINEVGTEMKETKAWKNKLLAKPKFIRVNEFADSAVIVRISAETLPAEQWDVAGELRKRLKSAFDKEGIEIPYPQRVIHTHTTNNIT